MLHRLLPTAVLSFSLLLVAACSTPEERAAGYAAKATELFEAGEFKRAKLEAQNALQVAPKNVPARYLLAQMAEQDGEVGQMLGHLEVVIGEDPTHVPSRLKLATILVFAQDYNGAGLLLDELKALAPDDPEVRLLEARLLFQKGELQQGIQALDYVIEREPANVEAALLRGMAFATEDPEQGLADLAASIQRLGPEESKGLRQARIEILNQQKRVAEVESELKALVKDYPDGGYARDLAAFYVAQDRLAEAEQALAEAVRADPDNFELKFSLAQFQSRTRNDPQLAEQTLKAFIAEAPEDQRLPILLGTFYEASERKDEAIAQYEAVVRLNPKSEEGYDARVRLANLKLGEGNRAEARAAFDAILADAPDNVKALAARGQMNVEDGRLDDALADLRGALRKEPENQAVLQSMARAHVARADWTLAQDAYRRLLQVNPRQPEAATALAGLLLADQRLDEAETLYRQVIEAQPGNLAAGSGLVEVLIARRDLQQAEAEARRLAALDDPRGVGQLQLGKVLQATNDLDGAAAAFRAALRKDPASSIALRGLVGSLTIAGKLREAGQELRAFLQQNPEDVEARLLLGGNLLRVGQLEESRQALEQVIAARPADSRAYILLATTHADDPAAREAILRRGINANPVAQDLIVLLGTDYMSAARWDDAIALFEKSLAANPNQPVLANNLASLLLDHRSDAASHQRALDLARPFVNSRDPSQLDTLGWAHYRLKDYNTAVQFLERALAINSENPVVQYHLGMAYAANGNPVGATQQLEKVLATTKGQFPGAEEARETLKKLAASPG